MSNSMKFELPLPSTACEMTTKCLSHTPWILGTGEKQLDLHTTISISSNDSFPLKMLVDSSSSGSLIDKHLVHRLGIPKTKLPHLKLLINADHSMNEQVTHII